MSDDTTRINHAVRLREAATNCDKGSSTHQAIIKAAKAIEGTMMGLEMARAELEKCHDRFERMGPLGDLVKPWRHLLAAIDEIQEAQRAISS